MTTDATDSPRAPLTSTERSRRRRQQLRTDGRVTITASLDPEAAAALARLRAGGWTVDQAVARALRHAAACGLT